MCSLTAVAYITAIINTAVVVAAVTKKQRAELNDGDEETIMMMTAVISCSCTVYGKRIRNESVPIQLAQCLFPAWASHFQC